MDDMDSAHDNRDEGCVVSSGLACDNKGDMAYQTPPSSLNPLREDIAFSVHPYTDEHILIEFHIGEFYIHYCKCGYEFCSQYPENIYPVRVCPTYLWDEMLRLMNKPTAFGNLSWSSWTI